MVMLTVIDKANNTKFGLASGVFIKVIHGANYKESGLTLRMFSKVSHGDVDGVIDRANNTEFGLASGVFTKVSHGANYKESKLTLGMLTKVSHTRRRKGKQHQIRACFGGVYFGLSWGCRQSCGQGNQLRISAPLFRCGHATLKEALSVGPSVRQSVSMSRKVGK